MTAWGSKREWGEGAAPGAVDREAHLILIARPHPT